MMNTMFKYAFATAVLLGFLFIGSIQADVCHQPAVIQSYPVRRRAVSGYGFKQHNLNFRKSLYQQYKDDVLFLDVPYFQFQYIPPRYDTEFDIRNELRGIIREELKGNTPKAIKEEPTRPRLPFEGGVQPPPALVAPVVREPRTGDARIAGLLGEARVIFDKYGCARCHNSPKGRGGLSLVDERENLLKGIDWLGVWDQADRGTMPPSAESNPNNRVKEADLKILLELYRKTRR